jgi:hypothetical protein
VSQKIDGTPQGSDIGVCSLKSLFFFTRIASNSRYLTTLPEKDRHGLEESTSKPKVDFIVSPHLPKELRIKVSKI